MSKFLDETSLKTLTKLIKAEDKKISDKLGNIRTDHTAEGDIIALENLVGSVDVETQIKNAIKSATGSDSDVVNSIKTNTEAISVINGTGEGSIANSLREAKNYTNEKSDALTTRVLALENRADAMDTKTGGDSVEEQISNTINSLDANVDSQGGERVDVQIVEKNGIITSVRVSENDIAQESDLLALSEKVGKPTDAFTASTGLIKRIEDLETSTNTTLPNQLTSAIGAIDGKDVAEAISKVLSATTTAINTEELRAKDKENTISERAYKLEATHVIQDDKFLTVKQEALNAINDIPEVTKDSGDEDIIRITATSKAGSLLGIIVDDSKLTDKLTDIEAKIATESANRESAITSEINNRETAITNEVASRNEAITSAIGDVKTFVGFSGGVNVATQISNAINDLDVDNYKDGISSASGHITVGLQETDGKITSLTVTDSDIASATTLGTTTDTKDKETAFGYIAKETDRATTAESGLDSRLDTLEGASNVVGSVAEAKKAGDDAQTLIGTVPSKVGDIDTTTVVGYIDASLALKAPLASPALTGTPTAPTPASDNSSTQIATTAFVNGGNVVESGTNYVKYGNGMLVCWGNATEDASSVTLPLTFKNTPVVNLTVTNTEGVSLVIPSLSEVTTSKFTFQIHSFDVTSVETINSTSTSVHWIAVGM